MSKYLIARYFFPEKQKASARSGVKSAKKAGEECFPIFQVIDVDTKKPLKILNMINTSFLTKSTAENLPSNDPVTWLQNQLIEVEVCSSEIPVIDSNAETTVDTTTLVEAGQNYCSSGDKVETKQTREEEGETEFSGSMAVVLGKRKKERNCENVDEDMELDEPSGKYRCKRCNSYYKSKGSVINHLRYICIKNPKFACSYCPFKSKMPTALRVHYGRYHSGSALKTPSGTKTGLKKKNYTAANQMQGKSSDLKPLDPQIEKIPEKEFEYDEESKRFTCKNCFKTIKFKKMAEKHKKILCGKDKNLAHKCVFCPYTGSTSTIVRWHMGRNHGKWPKLDKNGVWIY